METVETTTEPRPEIWQHTDDQGRVLLVKCVSKDGKGYGGFQWPKSGPVDPGKYSKEATCESGGLFGWAWGLNIGGGKEPDYTAIWIVFAAPKESVVDLCDKQKTGPAEVLYYGDWFGALQFTSAGREAYHKRVADWCGKNGSSNYLTGDRSASSSTGDMSALISTGYRSALISTGDRSALISTGDRSASSSTGDMSALISTGYRSALSSTGDRSAAIVTGECSTIEVGPTCVATAMALVVFWRYRKGAVLIQRWNDDDGHPFVVLQNLDGVDDGELLRVERGQWTKH